MFSMTFLFLRFLFRRKDYYLGEELQGEGCPFPSEKNLQSVQHLRIASQRLPKNSINYFPNATQLTIEPFIFKSNETFLIDLNRCISLKQITQLNIEHFHFSLEQIIRLLGLMPNLHTLKFTFDFIRNSELESLDQSAIFQEFSTKNRVRYVYSADQFSTIEIHAVMKLFPHVQHLHVQVERKRVYPLVFFFFQNNFRSVHRLNSLCLSGIPRTCFHEVDILLKVKNLLDNYCIKHLNRDLYIWW